MALKSMEYKSQDDTNYKVEDFDEKYDQTTADDDEDDMDIAHMMVYYINYL